jgi:hypothetical protein
MPRIRPAAAIDQRFMRVEAAERRAEIVPAPVPSPVSVPAIERDRPQQDVALLPDEFHVTANALPADPMVKPTDSTEIVRETVREVYASIQSPVSGWFRQETARGVSTPPLETPVTDLTAIAEETFDAGLSSGVLQSNTEERPDSKK